MGIVCDVSRTKSGPISEESSCYCVRVSTEKYVRTALTVYVTALLTEWSNKSVLGTRVYCRSAPSTGRYYHVNQGTKVLSEAAPSAEKYYEAAPSVLTIYDVSQGTRVHSKVAAHAEKYVKSMAIIYDVILLSKQSCNTALFSSDATLHPECVEKSNDVSKRTRMYYGSVL